MFPRLGPESISVKMFADASYNYLLKVITYQMALKEGI